MTEVKIVRRRSETCPLDERELGRRKLGCLIGLAILAAINGVISQLFVDTPEIYHMLSVVFTVVGTGMVIAWFFYDSQQLGFVVRKRLWGLIVLIAAVGIPYYLFRTRGIRGIVSIAVAVSFAIICFLIQELAAEITYRISDG